MGASCHDGNGGASKLFQEFLAKPEEFLPVTDSSLVGSLIRSICTLDGKKPVQSVVTGIMNLLLSIVDNSQPGISTFQDPYNSTQLTINPINVNSIELTNKEIELRMQKLQRLRNGLIIETDIAIQFKLEKQVEEEERHLRHLENRLCGTDT